MTDRPAFSVKSDHTGRSAATREKLINAGLDLFGSMGYDAATTRRLAERAGVNLAAIPYHFGGKEGLYHAVVRFISDTILEEAGPGLKEGAAILGRPDASREHLLQGLEQVLRAFGRFIIGSEYARWFGPIIMKEQMQPSAAFDIIFDGGLGMGHKTLCRFVARLMDRPEDDPETVIRAHTILGQIMAFRAGREIFLRQINRKTLTEEAVEELLGVIMDNCSRIFMCGNTGQEKM